MQLDRYETYGVKSFMPKLIIILTSMFAIREFTGLADSVWQEVLIWVAVLSVGCLVVMIISPGDVILTPEGILEKSWCKKRMTPWNEIIQVSACMYEQKPTLVLVRADGYRLQKENRRIQFYLRNIDKLILLPDRRAARQFVEAFYGPLDFDLTYQRAE